MNREDIARERDKAAAGRESRELKGVATISLMAVGILGLFAGGLSKILPAFLPAHPGFWDCWTLLLIAYFTIWLGTRT